MDLLIAAGFEGEGGLFNQDVFPLSFFSKAVLSLQPWDGLTCGIFMAGRTLELCCWR